jgi:zinc finger protein BrlA
MEPDDMSFSTSSFPNPAGLQEDYFCMSEGTNDAIPVLGFSLDQNLLFPYSTEKKLPGQSMMGYSDPTSYGESTFESFDIQNTIQDAPTGLELDMYAQMSALESPPFSMDFVVPSQTTFAESYNSHTSLLDIKPLPLDRSDSTNSHHSVLHTPDESDKFRTTPLPIPRSCPAPRLRPSSTRKPVFESLQSSLDLESSLTERYGTRQLRKQKARRGSSALPTVPSHVRVQNKAIKKCTVPDCNARFQRQEHLKRHEKTHEKKEIYTCQFCLKPFGRSDNLKSHTRLHTKSTARTRYFPDAMEVYEQMTRKPRKSQDATARVTQL